MTEHITVLADVSCWIQNGYSMNVAVQLTKPLHAKSVTTFADIDVGFLQLKYDNYSGKLHHPNESGTRPSTNCSRAILFGVTLHKNLKPKFWSATKISWQELLHKQLFIGIVE